MPNGGTPNGGISVVSSDSQVPSAARRMKVMTLGFVYLSMGMPDAGAPKGSNTEDANAGRVTVLIPGNICLCFSLSGGVPMVTPFYCVST